VQQVLLIGVAVVFGGLLVGWILGRRHASGPADIFHFGASALARFLGAVALAWSAARVLNSMMRCTLVWPSSWFCSRSGWR